MTRLMRMVVAAIVKKKVYKKKVRDRTTTKNKTAEINIASVTLVV